VSGDARFDDEENLRRHAADNPPPPPRPLTAAEQRRIADLVRYGAPVEELPDIARYTAA
jgi:hypothetical protein